MRELENTGPRERGTPGFETRDPTINDDAEGRIRLYHQTAHTGGQVTAGHNSKAYCAAFVTFCLRNAGVTGVRGSADINTMRAQFENAGRFHEVPQDRPYDPATDHRPQPGDVIFFRAPNGDQHVGFVVNVESSGAIHTLEGNTWGSSESNAGVMERVHYPTQRHGRHRGERTNILGFGSIE